MAHQFRYFFLFSHTLLLLILLGSAYVFPQDLSALREETRTLYYHAYDNYMNNAFPADELQPISCTGRVRSQSNSRGTIDDSLGGFSLTLIDSLDSLIVMGNHSEFKRALDLVKNEVKFDNDVFINVFEVTIRLLGGLMSAHLLAISEECPILGYDGFLIEKATDLGLRLLPAFQSPTRIPYSRINLKTGKVGSEKTTCLAGAGTLILEFGMLSKLSGYSIFQDVAEKAMKALVARRSMLGLFSSQIDVETGLWTEFVSGIGAGSDSFYEYLFKYYVLFGDQQYFQIFNETYSALLKYVRQKDDWYLDVDPRTGMVVHTFISSLQAFWPGLLVQVGDLENAVRSYKNLHFVWKKYQMLPETFHVRTHTSLQANYPLRPEFVESTYFLYLATRDPFFLQIGADILRDIKKHTMVPCGFASIYDVNTKVREDRMDSFLITETFKYLYLLFDPDHFLNSGNYVFSTEGHPFPVQKRNGDVLGKDLMCPALNDNIKQLLDSTNVPQPIKPTQINFNLADIGIVGDTIFYFQQTLNGEVSVRVGQNMKNHKQIKTKDESQLYISDEEETCSAQQLQENGVELVPAGLSIMSPPEHQGKVMFGSYAHFGPKLAIHSQLHKTSSIYSAIGEKIVYSQPNDGCSTLTNMDKIKGRVGLVDRGSCAFVDKVRNLQLAGAQAALIVDVGQDASVGLVIMTAAESESISIPSIFLTQVDGNFLKDLLTLNLNVSLFVPKDEDFTVVEVEQLPDSKFFDQTESGIEN